MSTDKKPDNFEEVEAPTEAKLQTNIEKEPTTDDKLLERAFGNKVKNEEKTDEQPAKSNKDDKSQPDNGGDIKQKSNDDGNKSTDGKSDKDKGEQSKDGAGDDNKSEPKNEEQKGKETDTQRDDKIIQPKEKKESIIQKQKKKNQEIAYQRNEAYLTINKLNKELELANKKIEELSKKEEKTVREEAHSLLLEDKVETIKSKIDEIQTNDKKQWEDEIDNFVKDKDMFMESFNYYAPEIEKQNPKVALFLSNLDNRIEVLDKMFEIFNDSKIDFNEYIKKPTPILLKDIKDLSMALSNPQTDKKQEPAKTEPAKPTLKSNLKPNDTKGNNQKEPDDDDGFYSTLNKKRDELRRKRGK